MTTTLQPADWSRPKGFSHGMVVDAPGRWVVLAGQTGHADGAGYPADFAAQTKVALERIVRLLREAGAGPEHIVRLNWYITDRAAYFAAGAGVAAAWREVLGRQFPTSTLLFVSGLIDEQAKVEIEVTAYVPN